MDGVFRCCGIGRIGSSCNVGMLWVDSDRIFSNLLLLDSGYGIMLYWLLDVAKRSLVFS